MTVEQILEQLDKNMSILRESLNDSQSLSKEDAKKQYGTIKTYEQCMSMEKGAITALINFRQWIVNNK